MKNNHTVIDGLAQSSDICIAPRLLKVVEIGDFWAKKTIPSIRLQGKWIQRAGILPNHHVCITNPEPGILMIRLQEIPTSESSVPMHRSQTRIQIPRKE